MNIENIITEINDTDDKRSVILKVENEISKLQSFNHKKSDIQKACSIDFSKLDDILDKIPINGRLSIVSEHVEKLLTKRELAVYFAFLISDRS